MNRSPDEIRFRSWLAERAPRSTPPGLLARSVAELDRDPRQRRRWGWSVPSSLAFVPALAGLVGVAVVGVAAGYLFLRPAAVVGPAATGSSGTTVIVSPGDSATDLPTESATAVPTESATAEPSESATASATATPIATVTPRATAAATPVATATPPGPPGSLTFRLILTSLPPGTESITLFTEWEMISPSPDGHAPDRVHGTYYVCGGGGNPEPCAAPGSYEQILSGFEPGRNVYYSLQINLTAPDYPILAGTGQRAADGSVVEVTYPAAATTPPPSPGRVSCVGDLLSGHRDVWGTVSVYEPSEFRATEDMCITAVTWSQRMTTPTAGTATLTVDGRAVHSIDLAQWDSIGTPGGGSGERRVMFSTAIGVADGQTLRLVYSGCSDCVGNLGLYFQGVVP